MLWSELERFGRFIDPWREFEKLNRALWRPSTAASYDFPPVNVWVKEDNIVVTTEIPGIGSENIDIAVSGKALVVKGIRKQEQIDQEESYHRKERWSGQFTKTVELPFSVDPQKVEAALKNGILTIFLPRATAEIPKKITIKAH